MWKSCAINLAFAALVGLAACGSGTEPARLSLPLVLAGAGLEPFTTAQGYRVELSALRVALSDIELTVEGETHAGLWPRLRQAVLPRAWAHPGHYAGGEVTGELLGDFLVDLFSGADQPLGHATLLAGRYHGMNFTFRQAAATEVASDDPLLDHTIALAGQAQRDDRQYAFSAVLDVEPETAVVGAPFEFEAVSGSDEVELVFRMLSVDPSDEGDTLFDGVDFAALAPAVGEVTIEPGSPTHNVLRRRIQVHDHWRLEAR